MDNIQNNQPKDINVPQSENKPQDSQKVEKSADGVGKINKNSYIELINDDITALDDFPHCLEKHHIIAVLKASISHYYPDRPDRIAELEAQLLDQRKINMNVREKLDESEKQNQLYKEALEWLSTINPCIEYDDFKKLVNETAEQALNKEKLK